MGFSLYTKTKVLNHIYRSETWTPPTVVYLALFTTMPAADDTGAVEFTGGSYARQAVTFGSFLNGFLPNDVNVVFTNSPALTMVGGGFYDALTGGNLLQSEATAPRPIPLGEDLTIGVGELLIGF